MIVGASSHRGTASTARWVLSRFVIATIALAAALCSLLTACIPRVPLSAGPSDAPHPLSSTGGWGSQQAPRVLLVGSSTIQRWSTSERDLRPLATSNIGIGGSVIADWIPRVATQVAPVQADGVLVYVGANDLHVQKSPPQTAADAFATLLDAIRRAAPGAQIFVVSVLTTPRSVALESIDDTFNLRMKRLAESTPRVTYIDVTRALRGPDGTPSRSMFGGDAVHLNADGYAAITPIIRDEMSRRLTPAAPSSAAPSS